MFVSTGEKYMSYQLNQLKNIPNLPGIYKFFSAKNEILYVGKAKNLKKRIESYFLNKTHDKKTSNLVALMCSIEVIPVVSEFEALLLEAKMIHDYQPKYNISWKDDKHYIYICITKELYPRVLFARKEHGEGLYFGPFPSAGIVKELLRFLRTIFPYCTQGHRASRVCFYNHLGLCNPCPAHIKQFRGKKYETLLKQYKTNIKNIKNLLEGKISKVRKLLTKRMYNYSEDKKFEEAADLRDKISGLDYLVSQYTPIESYIYNPKHLEKVFQQEENGLLICLKKYFPKLTKVKRIECFDISNISGKQAAGSMVTFVNNNPDKNLYRRFKIRSTQKPNDIAMLREVMSRRIKHRQWGLPDLFVIDGGRPQLLALRRVLADFKINIPIIGLAKHYEEIVVPQLSTKKFIKLKLPENSPALHLILRIRDEAHRFAHKYHSLLRLKHLLTV